MPVCNFCKQLRHQRHTQLLDRDVRRWSSNMAQQRSEEEGGLEGLVTTFSLTLRGGAAKKNSRGGLKGSESETRIRVEGGVLLGGESSQKL